MSIFAIADLHLSLGGAKPMDVFQGWADYVPRLEAGWKNLVRPEDLVVVPGDISWAMKLEECEADFRFINALPGRKVLLKGNHDYWWTTKTKMDAFCAENGFDTLHFLQNDCFVWNETAVCGTRSWFFDAQSDHDVKMRAREEGRLRASLTAAGDREKLVFLHYPPLYQNQRAENILALFAEFGVKECYYGHLHGRTHAYAFQGEEGGVKYKLVSADALRFVPYLVK